jgi:TPR repeat protein
MRDPNAATSWLRGALRAQANDPALMLTLAERIDSGVGCAADAVEATDWVRRAAELGDPSACRAMGVRLRSGIGAKADPAGAIEWLVRASESQDVEAPRLLAELHAACPWWRSDFGFAAASAPTRISPRHAGG